MRGALLVAGLVLLGGCSRLGINLGAPRETWGAHVVFLAPPGCSSFAARTVRHGFTLLRTDAPGHTPAQGDVLEGPVREGRSVFRLYAVGEADATRTEGRDLPLDVLAVGLPLGVAHERLAVMCGPLPPPPGTGGREG
ncbi:MAG TPA: hypothetical protein VD962_03265 [Rubricoccaceae bacterium]|nr:hypothetical protein [Rubricoccaceae bacterium]